MTRRAFASLLAAQARRPNVVLILTDNHGAWTLGCYGNREIRTPHIDRLAAEGTLFTRAHAPNAVCSPTRASLLTGLMPSGHGLHTYLGAGGAQMGAQAYDTLAEFVTLPKVLTGAGYTAGLVGKWHLGANAQPREGFAEWVTMPHGHTPGFYDQEVVEDGAVRRQPGYLTEFWTQRAVRFLERHHTKPFFLFLAFNGPYGLGAAMEEPLRNAHAADYAASEMASMPRDTPHPWNHQYAKWVKDNIHVRRKYASEVSAVDDGVGRVMDTLKRLGHDEDTVVIFLGDQGLAAGHSGFWGMGDHSRPLTGYDWNTWIPCIWRQPGRIASGQRSDRLVSTCDVFPTLLRYLGLGDRLPAGLPGRDYSALLEGRALPQWDDTVFFEFENVRSIRTAEWKYIERIHEEPNELYDLVRDPGERLNLAGRPEHAARQAALRERLQAFFAQHANPKWDLWKGGRSKANLLQAKKFGAAR